MLEGLRGEGEATVLVLWALTEEIRVLSKVRQGIAAGKPAAVLMRELRVWGPRERLVPQARSGSRRLGSMRRWPWPRGWTGR